jgi:hypothetical protein
VIEKKEKPEEDLKTSKRTSYSDFYKELEN